MKSSTIVLLVIALAVGIGAAAIVQQSQFPNEATVESGLTFYLNGMEWQNGTTIDWGKVHKSSSYFVEFNVTNTGTDNYTLSLITYPPVGWSQTWIENGTLLNAGSSLTGNLILTVASTASDGNYNWDMTVDAVVT
jgi:hypothetical protein